MQADYPESFERDTGGTEAEWLMRLPGACHGHALELFGGHARVRIDAGSLQIDWQVLPPRRIALLSIARMSVRFRFEGVGVEARQRFMKRFDLTMQRGGG